MHRIERRQDLKFSVVYEVIVLQSLRQELTFNLNEGL